MVSIMIKKMKGEVTMQKNAERFLKILLASWGIIFIWALIDGEGDIPQRAGAAFAFAVIIAVLLTLAPLGGADENCRPVDWSRYKPRDTGMISCRKCGYLGVGYGVCPRCGWSITDKITSQTKMMSCLKCGYLGADTGGVCPRCGWNRTRIIKW